MTDEPNNPIDDAPDRSCSAAAEPDLGQVETPPESAVDPRAEQATAEPASELITETQPPEVESEPAAETETSEVETEPVAETKTSEVETEPVAETKTSEVESEPAEEAEPEPDRMQWYILKVQSNREDSIREGLQRRVAIAGLEEYFGDVIVPIEKVTEVKGGRKRVVKRKLYPGYLVVQMEITDDTWFLVRETPGIGDFTGAAGRPTPMLPHEVSRIVATQEEKTDKAPKLQIRFQTGDRVKINEGTFENFEGDVDAIDTSSGRVTVMINIFGRSTPVELEYWQVETL